MNYNISCGIVSSGITANDWDWVFVSQGGSATDMTVNYGGAVIVSSGGYVNNVAVNSNADFRVSGGGIAENVHIADGGRLTVKLTTDTIVNGTVNGSAFQAASGFIANSDSILDVMNGATTYGAKIEAGGLLRISDGGMAYSTSIDPDGTLIISSGGHHSGMLQLESGAVVSAHSGSKITFDLTNRTEEDTYLINDLSLIKGTPTYTITVSAIQANGIYKLSQGASAFDGTITICTDNGICGTLNTNNKGLTMNNVTYELNNVDGDLRLSVSEQSVVFVEPIFVSGIFNGKSGVFELTGSGEGIIHNNTATQYVSGSINTNKWELLDSGDFTKTGNDGLLWLEKDTGYVYVQTDLSNFNEVINKTNCLGVVGEGYSILAVGDFTGTGIAGTLLQGPAFGDASISLNYGLPIWGRENDGTTFNGWLGALVNTWQEGDALKGDVNDLADINAKNYKYDVIATGDFNGDGVDDVMLQNTMPTNVDGVTITGSGDIFTFLTGNMEAVKIGADPTVVYSGCVTSDWEILGIGDFNGDGIDDVLLSDGTGLAGWQMAYGQRVENLWFGNLAANQEIVGIADMDNDGTDDLIVLDTAADSFSAWKITDGQVSGWIAVV